MGKNIQYNPISMLHVGLSGGIKISHAGKLTAEAVSNHK